MSRKNLHTEAKFTQAILDPALRADAISEWRAKCELNFQKSRHWYLLGLLLISFFWPNGPMLTEKISIILDSSSSVAAINWFILALPWLGAASLLNAFYLHLDKRFAQERVNLLLLAQHLDRAENT